MHKEVFFERFPFLPQAPTGPVCKPPTDVHYYQKQIYLSIVSLCTYRQIWTYFSAPFFTEKKADSTFYSTQRTLLKEQIGSWFPSVPNSPMSRPGHLGQGSSSWQMTGCHSAGYVSLLPYPNSINNPRHCDDTKFCPVSTPTWEVVVPPIENYCRPIWPLSGPTSLVLPPLWPCQPHHCSLNVCAPGVLLPQGLCTDPSLSLKSSSSVTPMAHFFLILV